MKKWNEPKDKRPSASDEWKTGKSRKHKKKFGLRITHLIEFVSYETGRLSSHTHRHNEWYATEAARNKAFEHYTSKQPFFEAEKIERS